MTTFAKHMVYTVTPDGVIERRTTELPSIVKLQAVTVSLAPDATPQRTARLLRRLANELEGSER